MKQSKKLLSIFLAILMLLGTVSVIGNAGYQKSTMAYDSVDNPAPNPDQVANLVLDVLDELLADMDFYENYVVIKLDLRSVDKALDTLWSFDGLKKSTVFSSFHRFLQTKSLFFDKLNIAKDRILLYNCFIYFIFQWVV